MDIKNSPSEPSSNLYLDICQHFKLRQDAIILTQHLVKIIKSIQQHRGMSMGFLGGDLSFREEIKSLQIQLEKRINTLHALTSEKSILTVLNQSNLINGWITISHNWQDDSVIDNYELHSHLIDQFLQALTSLSLELEKPISASDANENANTEKNIKIIHFITHLLPSLIERIGRVRALATYAAATDNEDPLHTQKLQYAIQCLRDENKKFIGQTAPLEAILNQAATLLTPLKSYDVKLMFLLKIIESDVLKKSDTKTDGHRIYNLSTDIIEQYLSMVNEGMALITAWHEADFERWLKS